MYAIRSYYAFRRGQQRPFAIAFQASALQDETGNLHGDRSENTLFGQATVHLVVLVRCEFEPPAIEAEVEKARSAILGNRDRPEIPGPGVVGRRITSYNVCYTKLLRIVFRNWSFT